MNTLTKTTLVLLVGAVAFGALGCSGKTEDVRINLCREMTERMLDEMKPIVWKSQSTEFRNIGDAAIKLGFSVNKSGYENTIVTSTCYFENDVVEESALEHANPLAAFSTIPYMMTVQGKQVPKEIFSQLLRDEQLEPFREFFDQVQTEIEQLKNR